jgi:hypothetical protein
VFMERALRKHGYAIWANEYFYNYPIYDKSKFQFVFKGLSWYFLWYCIN